MVLSKRKEAIDSNYVLSKISEFDIYKFYIPVQFHVGASMSSPLRKDRSPSFSVYVNKDNAYRHVDFAHEEHSGNCFNLVMQMYGLSYGEAVKKVARDFGISDGTDSYKKIVSEYKQPVVDKKRAALIQVTTKRMSKADVEWWAQYLITPEMLREENVYSVKELYLNRKRLTIGEKEKVYAYWQPEGFKIYMPERQKEEKWLSSISTKLVENLQAINKCDKIIISKSKKDRMVLQALFPGLCIINTQNESISAYTDSLIELLDGKQVWISYDSDGPGKAASRRVNEKYPWFKHVNVPDHYLPDKDWSDIVAKYGPSPVIEHFKQKNII